MYKGWSNKATYDVACKIDDLNYYNYKKWKLANPGKGLKDYCKLMCIVDENANWEELTELFD